MPEERTRSLFWPLALIAIGMGLLLDQLGLLTISWSTLWRFWPLILVLVGLDILLSRTRIGGIIFAVIAIIVVVGVLYYVPPQLERNDSKSDRSWHYSANGIDQANIRLEASVGNLSMRALEAPDNLIEAHISYDPRYTRLSWEADTHGRRAEVRLKGSQRKPQSTFGDFGDEWTVGLGTTVPIALDIDSGVSHASLDLSDVLLASLDLDVGVGRVDIVLSDRGSYDVSIGGGVGALRLTIPENTQARVRIDGGLGMVNVSSRFERQGKYHVTKEYRSAGDAIEIDIDGGVGSVTVE